MNDLEQRLARELGSLATDLDAPQVDTVGLVAAGRRERVRRRSVVAGAAAAAVVVLAVGASGVAGGGERAIEPAPAPSIDDLARPLELPWWAPDDELLRVGGAEVPAPGATRIIHDQDGTLVERQYADYDGASWSRIDRGLLVPLGNSEPFVGPPVLAPDGATAWVSGVGAGDGDPGLEEYAVVRESGSEQSGASIPGEPPTAVGLLADGRVLLSRSGQLLAWDLQGDPQRVTGLSEEMQVGPRGGGVSAYGGGIVVAGVIDDGNRFRALWETTGDGTGVWSDDGEQYAEGVRVSTEAGTTTLPLDEEGLRVVGWESDSEVVVAQWIEADRALVGLWRCSVTELRCAEVADAPNGRALLPGL